MSMNVKVTTWSEDKAPSESLIRERMDREGLHPYRWSNVPGDVYGSHSHPYHKVIYVVQGSIQFGLPQNGGNAVTLHTGDRLELPAGVQHDAVVGPEGVVCLEAHH
jgi:quercetin dioxygenase-like cupin family protein